MSEVKRFDDFGNGVVESTTGHLCFFTDLQSERAARIEAETKLAELEDVVYAYHRLYDNKSEIADKLNGILDDINKARSKS